MENFVFYYALFRDLEYAWSYFEKNSDFAKDFLCASKRLCELESQTFLNDESILELDNVRQILREKIKSFETAEQRTWSQWRLHIGLMCTFYEWCCEVRFFHLDPKERAHIFLENPIDWYDQHVHVLTESRHTL